MTDEDRYLIVEGRRWRRTDPDIPDALRTQLVRVLMSGRRGVGAAKRSGDEAAIPRARRIVHDAKVALGERGDPWWDDPTQEGLENRIAATIRTLLRDRDPASTICPSEVARAVDGRAWRTRMDAVRDVAARLTDDGVVDVRQGGVSTDPRSGGAIRLGRGATFLDD